MTNEELCKCGHSVNEHSKAFGFSYNDCRHGMMENGNSCSCEEFNTQDSKNFGKPKETKRDQHPETFNLSSMIYDIQDGEYILEKTLVLDKEDVKEFIRRLKDKLKYAMVEKESFISYSQTAFDRDIIPLIDSLAGEELVK